MDDCPDCNREILGLYCSYCALAALRGDPLPTDEQDEEFYQRGPGSESHRQEHPNKYDSEGEYIPE